MLRKVENGRTSWLFMEILAHEGVLLNNYLFCIFNEIFCVPSSKGRRSYTVRDILAALN